MFMIVFRKMLSIVLPVGILNILLYYHIQSKTNNDVMQSLFVFVGVLCKTDLICIYLFGVYLMKLSVA